MKATRLFILILTAISVARFSAGESTGRSENPSPSASSPATWNAAAAAQYLDARETWWQSWDAAKRDHATVCVSCHTVLPYALSRSSLRSSLGENEPTRQEHILLNNVLRRVTLWNEVQPFYPNSKTQPTLATDSRATESVLNALVLSARDARSGHLTQITRDAFDNMWALQIRSGEQAGAWNWQNFHLAPWESSESQYNGAVLGAIATGLAPESYQHSVRVQENVRLLRGFLRQQYAIQPLLNKVYLLWASARMPGLLSEKERNDLIGELAAKQHPDGGWSLSDLGAWQRHDQTAEETSSDGLATGLTVLALKQAGEGRRQVQTGLAWLRDNQNRDGGNWTAWSLNKKRDPSSDVGRFMSDAATGFAVLALENSN